MKKFIFIIFCLFLHLTFCSIKILPGLENIENTKLQSLYKTIDKKSVVQLFAFYKLYPQAKEGKLALKQAWNLLKQENVKNPLFLPNLDINMLINLVNKQNSILPNLLDENQLQFFQSLGKSLKNRNLKGNQIWKISEILKLNPEDIDLSRALFLEEFGEDGAYKIKHYEICLDLMALQILAKLENNSSDIDKINAINDFIFYEKRFRFPPHSIHSQKIDTFTFLSSVMDSRRGVCLGVSILYLSLAQRLGLNLEIVTPPGHIYIRYNDQSKIINIETTARGIDLPSDVYLSLETKKLQQRNIKEVVGLAFYNQASVYFSNKQYEKAIELYQKALKYIPNDPGAEQLLGFNLLFAKKIDEGKKILEKLKNFKPEYSTTKDNIIEDYLDNKTDIESIQACFLPVDSRRESILDKQKILINITKKYPEFRFGLFQLINTYLQLGREKEALSYLIKAFELDPNDLIVNYYLAIIFFERFDYANAWKHLKITENLLEKENHYPKALKNFKETLKRTVFIPNA